ncbi:MAG: peptidoglycan-associated lipoprotein Pal [Steroidobacteraceae bacterium]|jgi:peptidoglycan-associated lipoprotein|nr:peptidoglycan-associated lipoprotein Pal [Steroidobacteraceae bacterium]
MNRSFPRHVMLAVLAATGLALAGCAKKPTTVDAPAGETVGSTTGDAGATSGTTGSDVGEARPLPGTGADAAGATAATTTILFDFDSAEVRAEYNSAITAHARRIAASPAVRVRLEGNTDERGSPEYNIGLGERRAQAVKRALLLQGAPDAQITTVSYGEERPSVEGGSEEAWSQNRRVEIVYLGGGR